MSNIQHELASQKEPAEGSRETVSANLDLKDAESPDHGDEDEAAHARNHAEREPVTEAERTHGAGASGRLTGPKPPNPAHDLDTPVMGVVPPDPNMPDEVGDMDLMRGDPTRVREAREDRADTGDGEDPAAEIRRRELYRQGASEVSED
jgi:hypothetical protein